MPGVRNKTSIYETERSSPPAQRGMDHRIAAIAARQHGVISLQQLRSLGLSDSAVRSRVERGQLIRLHRGVYAVGHAVLRAEGHWLAAVLACGSGAALSHRSSAELQSWSTDGTFLHRCDHAATQP